MPELYRLGPKPQNVGRNPRHHSLRPQHPFTCSFILQTWRSDKWPPPTQEKTCRNVAEVVGHNVYTNSKHKTLISFSLGPTGTARSAWGSVASCSPEPWRWRPPQSRPPGGSRRSGPERREVLLECWGSGSGLVAIHYT